MSAIEKFRYKVNLKRHIADCDANYVRLQALLPTRVIAASRYLGLAGKTNRAIELTVQELTAHTTLLGLVQHGVCTQPWLQLPMLKIRLYHDVRVAEVVSYDRRSVPHSRYDYPNKLMYQQDEKVQWNRFLAELLSHRWMQGYEKVGHSI